MGSMLDESYIVEGTDDPPEATTETPEREEPAGEAAPEQSAKTPVVPTGRKRSRRDEGNEKLMAEFTGLKESISKERESYAEKLQRISEENARLHGEIRGYMQRPAPQAAPERQAPAPEDPRKILREANELLDKKDFEGYQERYADYIEARRPQPAAQAQQSYQGPPPVNPILSAVMSQYSDVVTDPRGIPMAQAQDKVLEAQGLPDGPDRWNRAFTEARRVLGKKTNGKPAQFSPANREVLSGLPTNGGTAPERSGEPGITLSPLEKEMARKFKMSETKYATHLAAMHPERMEK